MNFNTLKCGFTLGFGTAIDQGVRYLKNIILTRILAPELFGVMAIVLATNQAIEAITNIGIYNAIIQNKQAHKKEYLNIAFWVTVLRSLVLYLIITIAAPFIANFYNNEMLTSLLRVSFITTILNSLLSPRIYILLKDLKFKRWITIQNIGTILSATATVVLSILFKNIWALVIGLLLNSLFKLILSYIICPYKPGLNFDKQLSSELLQYTKGMFGLGLLFFIYHRGEVFILGKTVSEYQLGIYTLVSTLAYSPFGIITTIIDKIGMAKFSSIQDRNNDLVELLKKSTALIIKIAFPLITCLSIYSKDIITFTYGLKYAVGSVSYILISFAYLIQLLGIPISHIYFSKARPQDHRYFSFIRTMIFIVVIYPLTKKYGIIGAPISSLIAINIGHICQIKRLNTLLDMKVKNYIFIYFKPIIISSIGALFMVAGTFIFNKEIYYYIWGFMLLIIMYFFLFMSECLKLTGKILNPDIRFGSD